MSGHRRCSSSNWWRTRSHWASRWACRRGGPPRPTPPPPPPPPPPPRRPGVLGEELVADKKPLGQSVGLQAGGPSAANSAAHPVLIPPGRGELEFDYTALDFQTPEQTHFKYKLEDVDSVWFDAGARRVAHYNNIYSGRYRFRVIAGHSDGG